MAPDEMKGDPHQRAAGLKKLDWTPWLDGKVEKPICDWCGSPPTSHFVVLPNADGTPFNLVECRRCRLRFFSPRPIFAELLKQGYGKSEGSDRVAQRCMSSGKLVVDPSDPKAQTEWLRKYYSKMFDFLVSVVGPVDSIFEVGPCVGWFLKVARDRGVSVCVGCDLNKYAAELAQKEWKLSIYWRVFRDYVPKRKYKVIVMLDVIEHTWTPYQDLVKARSMVEPGGGLLIKTFLEDLDTERKMLSPPFHSHHFFQEVLIRCIEDAGFSNVVEMPSSKESEQRTYAAIAK